MSWECAQQTGFSGQVHQASPGYCGMYIQRENSVGD